MSQRLTVSWLARTISAISAAVSRRSAARRTICARVLSRASRVVRYNSSKASSCSGLRVGIRIGLMGSSSAHKLIPLENNLFVLSTGLRPFTFGGSSRTVRIWGLYAEDTTPPRAGLRPLQAPRRLYVVVDPRRREQPATSALVYRNARLRWDLAVAPTDRVVLDGAPPPVVGECAVLQRDAALGEYELVEVSQPLRSLVEIRTAARLPSVAFGLEGPQDTLHVALGQRPLVLADGAFGVNVGVGGEQGRAHGVLPGERPQAVVNADRLQCAVGVAVRHDGNGQLDGTTILRKAEDHLFHGACRRSREIDGRHHGIVLMQPSHRPGDEGTELPRTLHVPDARIIDSGLAYERAFEP